MLAVTLGSLVVLSGQTAPFGIDEITIAQLHAALGKGRLTCRSLVEAYLQRIAAHDRRGAALNAIVRVNPEALNVADDLDRRYTQSGMVGAMHCVPAAREGQLRDARHAHDGRDRCRCKWTTTGADAFCRTSGRAMPAR